MRTSMKIVMVLAALATACGSPQKTSKKGMSKLAADAPPPPSGGGPIDRSVSGEAKKDFQEAVAYFQEQAKGGWNQQTCVAAAQRFESVASSHKKMVEARYNAGLSYQQCGMNKEAEDQYHAALKIYAQHSPSLSNLGQIYFRGGNEARAKQYWEKAVEADKQIAGARNGLAWLMIRDLRKGKANLRDIEEPALRHLRSVLAVENDNVEAYVLLGLLYMQGSERNKSRLTLAKLLLDKAKEFDENFAPLWNARGLLSLRRDNVAGSLEEFQRAVALDPNFVEARMNVGNIVLGFRKYQEAYEQFSEVLKRQPKNYDAVVGLGIAQRGLRDIDKAEASYKKAVALDGNRAEGHFNLGVLYMDFKGGQTENLKAAQSAYKIAIEHFRRAQGKARDNKSMAKEAADNIKVCEKNIKSLDEAIKFQQQAPAAPTSSVDKDAQPAG